MYFHRLKNKNMKKSIIVLGIMSMIVSCSTTNFLKRKYTKGIYLESITHKSQTNKKELLFEKRVSSKNNYNQFSNLSDLFIEKSKKVKNNAALSANTINSKMYVQNNTNKRIVSNTIKSTAELAKSIASQDVKFDTQFKYLPNYFFSSSTKNALSIPSDDEKIIWIILCLFPFINLIPVYLHDGKKVTMNFILTLILDILFFIPGIIFALLIVLDIVNLA